MIGGSQSGSCFYDTNVLAAFMLRERGRFETARRVLRACSVRGVSVLSIHELYVVAARRGVAERFTEAKQLIERAFKLHGITQEVSIKAGEIRLRYGIPEVDSIILATAVESGYSVFYTFDADFQKLNGETVETTRIAFLKA